AASGAGHDPAARGELIGGTAGRRDGGPADRRTGGPADRRTGGPADRRTGGPVKVPRLSSRGARSATTRSPSLRSEGAGLLRPLRGLAMTGGGGAQPRLSSFRSPFSVLPLPRLPPRPLSPALTPPSDSPRRPAAQAASSPAARRRRAGG